MLNLTRVLLLAASVLSCKTTQPAGSAAQEVASSNDLKMCYGYRGNGTSVFATMGGIARLLDQFGDPSAVAGTSSGSVAAFLTESIMVPNSVYQCANCSAQQVAQRRSFMLKAFPLFLNALGETDDMASDLRKIDNAKAIFDTLLKLNPLMISTPQKVEPVKGAALAGDEWLNSPFVKNVISQVVLAVLRYDSSELKNMVSPDYYLISGYDGGEFSPDLAAKAIDNLLNFQGLSKAYTFKRQDLMYPGLLNFEFLYKAMGVLADWYAGYGEEFPRADLAALLDTCAADSRGVWWNPLASRPYGASTCGVEYYNLFSKYYNRRWKSTDSKKRVDEPMGLYMPSFVSTSAIGGNDIVAAMNKHADNQTWDEIDKLSLGRDNFKVLYFGAAAYKKKINDQKGRYPDVLTKSIVSMGSVPWRVGMRASAQEPAVARSVEYTEGGEHYLATGGYVDQIQTKLLKMVGCEKTVVINTNSPIYGFANRYAPTTWNSAVNLVDDIFDPSNPGSAESYAFEDTSGLLCSRWESYQMSEFWQMADSSYHNTLLVSDVALLEQQDLFKHLDGTRSTLQGKPKECYSLPKTRGEQYKPYDLKEARGR